MQLHHPSTHLCQLGGVYLMSITKVGVLLRPLFESVITSNHWTRKGSFASVYTNVVLQCRSTLTLPATPLAHVGALPSADYHLCDWVLLVVANLFKLKVGRARCWH